MWVLSSICSSVLVSFHSSELKSMIGMQYVLYSLMLVEGWRRPNRVPTLLRAKNALRAELARSIVLLMEDVPTVHKTPR